MKLFTVGMQFCKSILYVMSCLMLYACTPVSPEEAAFCKFTNSFSKEIEKEYGFRVFGVGASMPVKIEDITLCFLADYPSNLEQARKIVVPITLKFVKRMNEDENLLKYLANYPASLRNVILSIRFKESNDNPLISVMIIGPKNLVVYNQYNERHTVLVDLHEEIFDEAERIVLQGSL